MSERIANQVRQLGLEEKAVVVGSGPLDGLIRDAQNLDITVDDTTYLELRESHGWQEARSPHGKLLLSRNNINIGTHWGDYTLADLQPNSFVDHDVRFAGIPDVYAWKQDTARPKDLDDLALIRERLYARPLPVGMLDRDLGFVRNCLPEGFRHEPALAVAANGLYIVRTVFGDHRRDVRHYSGSVEQHVPGMYHDVWHSALGAERIAAHAARVNQGRIALGQTVLFSRADTLASVTGFSYHDSHLGDGRQSVNPTGFDELKAAELVARHLTLAGITADDIPEKAYVGVRATGFNQQTLRQDINPSRGYEHIQTAFAGADLGTFATPRFVVETMNLAIEDMCRVHSDQQLRDFATQRGAPIRTPQDALALIDQSTQLRDTFAHQIIGSADFCKHYDYPEGWSLDNPDVRVMNARFLRTLGAQLLTGELTSAQAYELAQRHATLLGPQ